MLEFVKQLFENNVISEEVKSEIETAWEKTVQENRDNVTTQLREEYAQKYEHDKTAMVQQSFLSLLKTAKDLLKLKQNMLKKS